jgi:AcrR family transcriptional regulator
MNAAERLFLEHGIAATSVDQIVAAADVAKGTFYLHFPSKENLLIALQQRYVAQHAQRLRTATERRPPNDWAGSLDAWIKAGIDFYLDRLPLHDLVFHEFRPEDRTPTHENLAVEHLAGLLQSGTQAGAWSVDNGHVMATMLFHALHGLLDETVHAGTKINRKELAHVAGGFFRRAVGLG